MLTELFDITATKDFANTHATANVEIDLLPLSLFWDGLEQSVICKDESTGTKICEIYTSRFYSITDFNERIDAAVTAAFEQAVTHTKQR